MNSHTFTIWYNIRLPEAALQQLQAGIGRHKLVPASSLEISNLYGSGADPVMDVADIAFGQPYPDQIITSPKLRWVHLTTAGFTRYERDDLRDTLRSRGGAMTNSSQVFDEPCAQHALAMMLALARQLPFCLDNQRNERGWKFTVHRPASYLLNGQMALLVGFGAIARRLTELLAPFKMYLIGVRRNIRGDEPIQMATLEDFDELLSKADHVVNFLPLSQSTTQFFDADRIRRMKKTAVFYNIGRGATVDQVALRTALTTSEIAAAYLDVTTPEPLPPDDPLWTTPNFFITPHTAVGHINEVHRLVAHFLENLRRFEQDAPLLDRVY